MQAAGAEIVGEIIYPFKHEDYTPFMQRILDAKPDLLAAANFGDEQVLFLKQAVAYRNSEKNENSTDFDWDYTSCAGRRRGISRGLWRHIVLLGKRPPNSTAKTFVDAYVRATASLQAIMVQLPTALYEIC